MDQETITEHKVVCPTCEGQGYHVCFNGGYFNVSYGNYLPKEEYELCEKCEGDGFIWVEELTEDSVLWKDEWTVDLPKALWGPVGAEREDYFGDD